MPHTDSLAEITQSIVDLLKAGNISDLGLASEEDIFYGIEARYPRFPAIAVEPLGKEAEPNATQFSMTNTFRVQLFVYEGALASEQTKKANRDLRAEKIRMRLHSNKTLDGKVAYGYVTNIEPGVSVVAASMVVASRMTWEGISKTEMR